VAIITKHQLTAKHLPENWKLWKRRLAFVSTACKVVTLQRPADFSISEETEGRKGSSGTDTRCRADCRNALDFYIVSRSSLGFNTKFQLAQSSTRLNSCTSSQSSPDCSSAIRTALAWRINKAHTQSCSMLRCRTLDATTLKCIVSNRCSRNCSTPNLKIVSGQGGSLHRTFYVIPGVAPPGGSWRGRIGSHGAGVGSGQNSAPWRWRIRYAENYHTLLKPNSWNIPITTHLNRLRLRSFHWLGFWLLPNTRKSWPIGLGGHNLAFSRKICISIQHNL
jgi:hypothetical protein